MFHVKICVNKNKTYDVDCTLCCHTFYMGTANPLHKIGPLWYISTAGQTGKFTLNPFPL